jgi:hypothetical protein
MSGRETGALRELQTSAERLQSLQRKLAKRPTRKLRTSRMLYRNPKQGRRSGDDVRQGGRQLPVLLRLKMLPKVETGQAISGP